MKYAAPDQRGYFGGFGGRFVPEILMNALCELEDAYRVARNDPCFGETIGYFLRHYAGRPSPLYFARRLSEFLGGARIYLKREDLLHTGAHKINNTIGQVVLARRIGKHRIIAETGAGQHGVATATICAMTGLQCTVYMGSDDMKRQRMNVLRMKLLGAEVVPVESGSRTLKDAVNQAIRDWVRNVQTTHYCIGSVVGPHPYPLIVRDFQSVIGEETKVQIQEHEGREPDVLIACVGGGSNAIGFFFPFIESAVRMIGVEGGGAGLDTLKHAATLCAGSPGVLHGAMTYLLQDQCGQIVPTHSISAGLDYPGVGPEHAYLKDTQRIEYTSATDAQALNAFRMLSQIEGIIPALESAHAVARAIEEAQTLAQDAVIVTNLSGRGDKDLEIVEGLV